LQKTLATGSLRKRLTAFFDLTITNFRSGTPPRGCPTTRGLMELGAAEGEGLDDDAREAFASLIARITALVRDTLSAGAARGEFDGNPAAAALHIVTVTRGLAVLERAFGDEPQLRKIAAHTIDLVLRKGG
ncbi:MAG: TetR/AcrR family transcriptional regulator, partial [Bradyrhizobiaceae bacterium]